MRYQRTCKEGDPLAPKELAGAPTWKAGELWEVESILKAEKRSGIWYIKVKWEGWADPTEERRSELLSQGCSVEVRHLVMEACANARMRKRTVTTEDDEEFESAESSDGEDETAEDSALDGQYCMQMTAEAEELYQSPVKKQVIDEEDIRTVMCLFEAHRRIMM